MVWFWYFVIYSFCGFLLEVSFAAAIRHPKRDRKCFYLLPLCPVYGAGAIAILSLPRRVRTDLLLLAICGALAATAVEYLIGVWDQQVLGIRFWDYSELPGSIGGGKVCLLFSLAWGVLAVALVRWLHPVVMHWAAQIPGWLLLPGLILVLGDALGSAVLLRRTGTTDCLKWYS